MPALTVLVKGMQAVTILMLLSHIVLGNGQSAQGLSMGSLLPSMLLEIIRARLVQPDHICRLKMHVPQAR